MVDSIEEVKQKTDIVSVIGERIELKKAGRNFKALCPFHGEKTPSFMVSPELQIFKCYGCGEGGDAFTFLQKYEGMEFGEALKYLADKAGVKLKPQTIKSKSDKERLYEINELIAKFYHYILTQHKAGSEALNYLQKERGINRKLIDVFQLGFNPNVEFAGKSFLVSKHKVSIKELVKVGLVYQRGPHAYDRFRGRVIFPLQDHRGNVIGFAGRILPKDSNKDLAKYINTPETEIYHKGNVLYGLNLTRSEIKRSGEVVVVEGELDLISTWYAGIKNVVALKGTAMTEDQVRLLSRFCQKIILMLDADLAGDAAARRGITIAQNLGMDIRVLELKKYKDPDEAARSDPEGLKKVLKSAVGVWDFIIDSIFKRFDAESGSGATKISREIVPILASIEDKIVQAHYAKIVADKLDVPISAVSSQLESLAKKNPEPKNNNVTKETSVKDRRTLLENRLLSLSFQTNPQVLLGSDLQDIFITTRALRIMESYLDYSQRKKKFKATEFVKYLPPELVEGFNQLMLTDNQSLVDNPDSLQKEILVLTRELNIHNLRSQLTDLTKQIRVLEKESNSNGLRKVEKDFSSLTAKLTKLEQK